MDTWSELLATPFNQQNELLIALVNELLAGYKLLVAL
jgi:hypothetical protein